MAIKRLACPHCNHYHGRGTTCGFHACECSVGTDDVEPTELQSHLLSMPPGHTSAPGERVNHPAHYGGADNVYEAIKVIEAWGLGFCLGNALKYIARAEHKGSRLDDLKKARWYLDREIQRSEQ